MTSRKVAVMTGTRADFGLLRPLLAELNSRADVTLQLIATGTHLSAAHGNTIGEVLNAGFFVDAQVSIWGEDDSAFGAAVDTGNAVAEFSRTLSALQPDVVVVLGDRLEAFAMATAAVVLQIPVAHIHGGELTLGAMDDSLRHAITKLSYLHFATAEEHVDRIVRMGEEPSRVFNFGAPVLDTLYPGGKLMHFMTKEELAAKFGVVFGARTALMTFHPAAFDEAPPAEMFEELLAAIDSMHEVHFIFTGTNNDIGSDDVRRLMAAFVAARPDRVTYVESFGQYAYLSAVHHVDFVVGNSSSTVLEAPLLGTPSVLVGNRQEGRPLAASVIKAHADRAELRMMMHEAMTEDFANRFAGQGTPFGQPGFAKKAADVLANATFATPLKKKFWEGQ
jgi:UDP-hydrolysing UDP-N-acetyl-D-glucosamine 2-epimerase